MFRRRVFALTIMLLTIIFLSCGAPEQSGHQGEGGTLAQGGEGGQGEDPGVGGGGGMGGEGGTLGTGGNGGSGGEPGNGGTGGSGAGGGGGNSPCSPPCTDPTPYCYEGFVGWICTQCLEDNHCPDGQSCFRTMDSTKCD